MNKKLLLVIVIFTITIALILPFTLSQPINEQLRVVANLLSGLGSFFTLIIAILLYNKYGIDKSIIEEKKEIVIDILKNIKCLTINIEFKITTDTSVNSSNLFFKPGTFHPFYENFYKHELIFNLNLLLMRLMLIIKNNLSLKY